MSIYKGNRKQLKVVVGGGGVPLKRFLKGTL